MIQRVSELVTTYRKQHPAAAEVLYTGVLLAIIVVFTETFTTRVWLPVARSGVVVTTLFDSAAAVLNGEPRVYWGVLGLLAGLVLTWTSDDVQRRQIVGPLALLATVGATTGISPMVLIPEGGIRFGEAFLLFVWFLITAVIGLQLGGIRFIQYAVPFFDRKGLFKPDPPYYYKRASTATTAFVVGAVLLGIVDFHIRYSPSTGLLLQLQDQQELVTNLAVGAIVCGALLPFTISSTELKIVQVGPARAGKSAMFAGTCARLKEQDRLFEGPDEPSTALKQVMSVIERNQFPDRTGRDEFNVLRFSYVSSNTIFRTKTTVSAVDYGGEILTGGAESDPLNDHVKRRLGRELTSKSESPFTRLWKQTAHTIDRYDPRGNWDEMVTEFDELEEPNTEELLGRLAELVVKADMLTFTLPMDDHLHNLVENRWALPDYANVIVFEKTETEGELRVLTHDGGSVTRDGVKVETITRERGEYYYSTDNGEKVFSTTFEELSDLPQCDRDPERYYALEGGATREDPDRYTDVYRELVELFKRRRTKQFTWVVTMADLVLEEFKQRAREEPSDRRLISNDSFANQIRAKGGDTKMKVFAKWILQKNVSHGFPDLEENRLLADTFQEFVYPVWFNLEKSSDGTVVLNDQGPVFTGGEFVTDRYDGQELVRERSRSGELSAVEDEYNRLATKEQDEPTNRWSD